MRRCLIRSSSQEAVGPSPQRRTRAASCSKIESSNSLQDTPTQFRPHLILESAASLGSGNLKPSSRGHCYVTLFPLLTFSSLLPLLSLPLLPPPFTSSHPLFTPLLILCFPLLSSPLSPSLPIFFFLPLESNFLADFSAYPAVVTLQSASSDCCDFQGICLPGSRVMPPLCLALLLGPLFSCVSLFAYLHQCKLSYYNYIIHFNI